MTKKEFEQLSPRDRQLTREGMIKEGIKFDDDRKEPPLSPLIPGGSAPIPQPKPGAEKAPVNPAHGRQPNAQTGSPPPPTTEGRTDLNPPAELQDNSPVKEGEPPLLNL